MLVSRGVGRQSNEVQEPMCLDDGKRGEPSSINAAEFDGSKSGRIFVTDKYTKAQFLVDTGADLCAFPRSRIKGNLPKSEYELYAANGVRASPPMER